MNTSAVRLNPGEMPGQYLNVEYGIIPDKVIQDNGEGISSLGAEWYSLALSHQELREAGLGKRLAMQILLAEGRLPDRIALDLLIEHGVHGSRTLDTDRTRYDQAMAREVIDAIYSGLKKKTDILKLQDVSDKVLEFKAWEPMFALHKAIAEARQEQEGAEAEEKIAEKIARKLVDDFGKAVS